MKFTFATMLVLLINASSYSKSLESVLMMNYEILSDTLNSKVPAGKCLVKGSVHANYYDDGLTNTNANYNFLVSTVDLTKKTHTDSSGNFSLLISEHDSVIFIFKEGFEEVVIRPYDFKSKHEVFIHFYPIANNMIITVDKPVIYFYSESEILVQTKLNPKSELTFAYPQYHDGWNLTCKENMLIDEKGRSYPYLFWEGQTQNLAFKHEQNKPIEGFIIKTDTLVSFLENTLNQLGLNAREQTDFITYWAPSMLQNEYVLVQFLVNDDYKKYINELVINPMPEALLQVFMLYTPLPTDDLKSKIEKQKFGHFERGNFTVVEWGGSKINQPIF